MGWKKENNVTGSPQNILDYFTTYENTPLTAHFNYIHIFSYDFYNFFKKDKYIDNLKNKTMNYSIISYEQEKTYLSNLISPIIDHQLKNNSVLLLIDESRLYYYSNPPRNNSVENLDTSKNTYDDDDNELTSFQFNIAYCFGYKAIENSIIHHILMKSDINDSTTIINPCWPEKYKQLVNLQELELDKCATNFNNFNFIKHNINITVKGYYKELECHNIIQGIIKQMGFKYVLQPEFFTYYKYIIGYRTIDQSWIDLNYYDASIIPKINTSNKDYKENFFIRIYVKNLYQAIKKEAKLNLLSLIKNISDYKELSFISNHLKTNIMQEEEINMKTGPIYFSIMAYYSLTVAICVGIILFVNIALYFRYPF